MSESINCETEIERRFLVDPRDLPLGSQQGDKAAGYYTGVEYQIFQNYIPNNGTKLRLRYRRQQSKEGKSCSSIADYFLTAKKGAGLKRPGAEIKIDKTVYDALLPLGKAGRISKRRRIFHCGEHNFEIDTFEAELIGLFIVEVEFKTEEESEAFVPPAWFGKEITNDARYSNENLAQYGRPKDDDIK